MEVMVLVPIIVLAPSGPLFEKTVSNMQEVQARGGKVVLISDAEGIAEAGENTIATIEMPKVHPLIVPLTYAIPVQLLAVHDDVLAELRVGQRPLVVDVHLLAAIQVLDRDLPRIHGDVICADLARTAARTRILMLTAAASVPER